MTGDENSTEEASRKGRDKRAVFLFVTSLLVVLAALVLRTRRGAESTLEPPF